jgi:hypothetical protein
MPILSLFEVPFLLATQSPIVCFCAGFTKTLGDSPWKSRLESLCFSVFNPQQNQCFTSDKKHKHNSSVARRLNTPRQNTGARTVTRQQKKLLSARQLPALRLLPYKFATSGR